MDQRFHLLISDVYQGNTETWYKFKIFLRDSKDGKILLRSSATLEVGCRDVLGS